MKIAHYRRRALSRLQIAALWARRRVIRGADRAPLNAYLHIYKNYFLCSHNNMCVLWFDSICARPHVAQITHRDAARRVLKKIIQVQNIMLMRCDARARLLFYIILIARVVSESCFVSLVARRHKFQTKHRWRGQHLFSLARARSLAAANQFKDTRERLCMRYARRKIELLILSGSWMEECLIKSLRRIDD